MTEITRCEEDDDSLRRWPRYKVDISIRLVAQGPTRVSMQGRGGELNSGGMAVSLGRQLSIDDEVAIEFTPPHAQQPMTIRAFVRDQTGSSYGLEFITENDTDYNNLAQLESVLKELGSVGQEAVARTCA